MSMLPYVFREMIRPLRMMEQHLRMTEELFRDTFPSPSVLRYQRRFPELEFEQQESAVVQDKDKFQVKLDVQNFKPEEITVKTVGNNCIEIEGKHERQDEKGSISRQFIRRFVLPKGHELNDVTTSLSSDGLLTVTAPKKILPEEQERIIPIKHVEAEKGKNDNEKSA